MILRPYSASSALLCSTSKLVPRLSKNFGVRRPGAQRSVKMSAKVSSPYLPDAPTDDKLPAIDKVYPHGIKSMSRGTTIYDAMCRLGTSFEEKPLGSASPYVKPGSVYYTFDGRAKRWDIVESHPSVGIVLFHRDLNAFLLVRQFRPAVYAAELRAALVAGLPPPSLAEGFTYELCAGLIDKAKNIKQICKEEIEEEGTSGAKHTMFFAEVDSSMQETGGGGLIDSECIEVLALPLEESEAFVLDSSCSKSPGLMFGVIWAYHAIKAGKLGSVDGNKTQPLELRSVIAS
ncbi:NUDIX hydrolase domain-like protein [Dunaliella salina]|uniref:NUDIX hydrolase domain-like protein n=1 Tax=Dunaliella salina TaxID=3046 RepID=A0ABQ7G9T4_DUNSA|nr:NUDIX hydrolase domain-like protein [Dunaliella salina]|eukprot:KAF5831368.1 NUDIX hydrolase domain-like protein [Dunaliella salina]